MDQQRLSEAIDVLREFAQALSNLPEERDKATQAWLTISDAALYLSEMRYHLGNGTEAYDALLSAVRGEMLIAAKGATIRF